MISDLAFVILLVAASAVFALLEIQIEGQHGWAAQLPTWRFQNEWTRRFLGERAITGYHVYFQMFMLCIAHLPYAFGAPLTWHIEMRVLSFLLLFWVLEDFLWFAFNRDWGLRRFRREDIWWHSASWWWFMPRDYWIFIPIGVVLYLFSR